MFGNSNARYHQIFSKLFHIGLLFGYQYLFMNNGKYFTKKLKENPSLLLTTLYLCLATLTHAIASFVVDINGKGLSVKQGLLSPHSTLTLFIDTRSYIKNKTEFVILFFK